MFDDVWALPTPTRATNVNRYAFVEGEKNFTLSISLPHGTKADSIQASVRDGILTVTVPKSEPEVIDIQVDDDSS
jgi:HSP20 family molecular chaperone IbpA